MVSFRFPPQGGVGGMRSAALARHLPDSGWSPHVLAGPADGHWRGWQDATLLEGLAQCVPVTRVRGLDLGPLYRTASRVGLRRLAFAATPFLPRLRAGWIPAAYRQGLRLIKRRFASGERFDAIYSSSPPVATHMVAAGLSAATGLPWIADARDLWSLNEGLTWPTTLHRKAAERLDERLLRRATWIVTTSPLARQRLVEAWPEIADRVSTVLNGFDRTSFQEPVCPPPGRPSGFVVCHVGSVPRVDAIRPLMRALDRAVERGDLPRDRVHVRFVGRLGGLPVGPLDRTGMTRNMGVVDHERAVAWIRSADLLLVLKENPTQIAAKTFEYLASGAPILGLTRGATADLILERDAGWVCDPADVDAIGNALVRSYREWAAGSARHLASPATALRHSHETMARQMADVFSRASTGTPVESPGGTTGAREDFARTASLELIR